MRILVTRPEPGAAATAARLTGLGHEPVVMPLSETAAVEHAALALDGIVAVAVTSANAVRNAPPALIESLRGLPWLAVGSTTAQVASQADIADVTDVDGDAAALARAVIQKFRAGDRLLYLCGRMRVPDFEQMLRSTGLLIDIAETYDIRNLDYADEALANIFGGPIDAALIYSAKSAEAMVRLMGRAGSRGLQRARLFAISHRAAAPLLAAGYPVEVSARPNEAEMLSLVGNLRR